MYTGAKRILTFTFPSWHTPNFVNRPLYQKVMQTMKARTGLSPKANLAHSMQRSPIGDLYHLSLIGFMRKGYEKSFIDEEITGIKNMKMEKLI